MVTVTRLSQDKDYKKTLMIFKHTVLVSWKKTANKHTLSLAFSDLKDGDKAEMNYSYFS